MATYHELLTVGLGILVSILFEYLPIIQKWFGGLKPWKKLLLVAVANTAAGVGLYLFSSWGALSWAGLGQAAWYAFLAFVSSLGTHELDKFRLKKL